MLVQVPSLPRPASDRPLKYIVVREAVEAHVLAGSQVSVLQGVEEDLATSERQRRLETMKATELGCVFPL
jgi:hypothetical protein